MSRLAVITGGSSGIGMGIAKLCARGGYDLHLVARGKPELNKVKKEIEAEFDTKVTVQSLDLATPNGPMKVFEEVMNSKKDVEILVNDAGFGDYSLFKDASWEKLSAMMNLNMIALTHLCHLFTPNFVNQHNGKIMNVASTAAFIPGPQMAVYHATKAFVLNFTEALAEELKDEGVSVTALCPGPTQSRFEITAGMIDMPLMSNKLPTSEEVAEFGYNAMMEGKRVAIHGLSNKLATEIPRFAPRKAVSFVVNSIYGRKKDD